MRVLRVVARAAGALASLTALAVGAWFASWGVLVPDAPASGRLAVAGLDAPVTIVRDRHGIPSVQAGSLHDAYEAQGYVEAQDRLFQMDILRRFVAGRLAEIFGGGLVQVDIRHRELGLQRLAEQMYAHASPDERMALDAYARGVNEAIAHEPLPPEFRVLLYEPESWRPTDSILCGIATVIDLTHTWNQIALRDAIDERLGDRVAEALYPITDPKYDAPLLGHPGPVAAMPPLHRGSIARPRGAPALAKVLALPRDSAIEASNAWAIGGAHTRDGRALLANDPHLDFTVPMVWYAIGLHAPGLAAIGGSLPGTPGIVLGHNAHMAWGATNGNVSTITLYRENLKRDASGTYRYVDPRTHQWEPVRTRVERIDVRGARSVALTALSTVHGFVVLDRQGRPTQYAAQWVAERAPRSVLATFLRLDRASKIEEALDDLRAYPGPPLNVVLADDRGRAAYHLAGFIPNDGVWSMHAVDGARVVDAWRGFVPFDALPHVDPSRDAVVFTANNRMYGAGYPYRLTDAFGPPYRAARIAAYLLKRDDWTVEKMVHVQLDDLSLPERELVQDVLAAAARRPHVAADASDLALLRSWDGRFDGRSRAATLAFLLRRHAEQDFAVSVLGADLGSAWLDDAGNLAIVPLLRALRDRPAGWFSDADGFLSHALQEAERDATSPPAQWRDAGATQLRHPLSNLRISLFNPGSIPGWGDAYSVKAQTPAYGQSFRAVWKVGAWGEGGMVFPLGESGVPRTPHYADLLDEWERGTMEPLPL